MSSVPWQLPSLSFSASLSAIPCLPDCCAMSACLLAFCCLTAGLTAVLVTLHPCQPACWLPALHFLPRCHTLSYPGYFPALPCLPVFPFSCVLALPYVAFLQALPTLPPCLLICFILPPILHHSTAPMPSTPCLPTLPCRS
jgi:hypothetical protein